MLPENQQVPLLPQVSSSTVTWRGCPPGQREPGIDTPAFQVCTLSCMVLGDTEVPVCDAVRYTYTSVTFGRL
jgi:hypothetical protein